MKKRITLRNDTFSIKIITPKIVYCLTNHSQSTESTLDLEMKHLISNI